MLESMHFCHSERTPLAARPLPFASLIVGALLGLVFVPVASAATLFGLVNTGELYESPDGGASWTIRSTLPVSDAVALGAGNTSSDLFLLSETGSFYSSTDAGMTWVATSTITASDVTALVPDASRLMVLTRTGSIYTSTDMGSSWSGVGAITASDIVSGTIDGSTYYALTKTGSVYESNDNGATWAAVGAITTSDAVDIAAFNGSLWVLTGAGALAKSTDSGATWSFVSTLSQVGMTTLIKGENELAASTGAGEVAATSDGTTWTWRGVINQITVRALATDIPIVTGVGSGPAPPLAFSAPWPNPATTRLSFALDLEEDAIVSVDMYDMAGRLVARPVSESLFSAGRTVRTWQPQGLQPGIYHLRARVGDRERVRRVAWLGR